MRNKYPGICTLCKNPVAVNEGHFERHYGSWIVKHAECVIEDRKRKVSGTQLKKERK